MITIAFVCILYCANFSELLKRLRMKLARMLFWNSVMRLLIEAYFDIVMALGVSLLALRIDNTDYQITATWQTLPGVMISRYFACFFAVICTVMPIFVTTFYLINVDRWDEDRWR